MAATGTLTEAARKGWRWWTGELRACIPQRVRALGLTRDLRVEMSGNRLTFDLTAEWFAKGFRIEGDPGKVVFMPQGLTLWRQPEKTVKPRAADPETERRLRSLGYIQ